MCPFFKSLAYKECHYTLIRQDFTTAHTAGKCSRIELLVVVCHQNSSSNLTHVTLLMGNHTEKNVQIIASHNWRHEQIQKVKKCYA